MEKSEVLAAINCGGDIAIKNIGTHILEADGIKGFCIGMKACNDGEHVALYYMLSNGSEWRAVYSFDQIRELT